MPTPPDHGSKRLRIAAAIVIWPLLVASAATQSGTPVADPFGLCDVAPRSREEIAALLAAPDIATPLATTSGQTLPEGIPVSADSAAAIDTLVRTWLACHNAGEPLRAWALFSDGYLYRLLVRQGMPEVDSAPATAISTNAGEGARLLEMRGRRELPDGRLGAMVVIAYPSVPMPKTFFFTFTDEDGSLVIDGILGEISFAVP